MVRLYCFKVFLTKKPQRVSYFFPFMTQKNAKGYFFEVFLMKITLRRYYLAVIVSRHFFAQKRYFWLSIYVSVTKAMVKSRRG